MKTKRVILLMMIAALLSLLFPAAGNAKSKDQSAEKMITLNFRDAKLFMAVALLQDLEKKKQVVLDMNEHICLFTTFTFNSDGAVTVPVAVNLIKDALSEKGVIVTDYDNETLLVTFSDDCRQHFDVQLGATTNQPTSYAERRALRSKNYRDE